MPRCFHSNKSYNCLEEKQAKVKIKVMKSYISSYISQEI